MNYINHGHLKGKVSVNSGTTLDRDQQLNITRQAKTLARMSDPKFREAVRLAARADGVLNGTETAPEQLYRHSVQPDLTTRGMIATHNRSALITSTKSGIIC